MKKRMRKMPPLADPSSPKLDVEMSGADSMTPKVDSGSLKWVFNTSIFFRLIEYVCLFHSHSDSRPKYVVFFGGSTSG